MTPPAQTAQALPPRPLYASTQLRTLGEAFAFVKEAKAKLVSQVATLPVFYILDSEREAYVLEFQKLRSLTRRMDWNTTYLYLFCSQSYVSNILEIIVTVQCQLRVMYDLVHIQGLMTLEHLRRSIEVLEDAEKTTKAIQIWTASEEGIRLQGIANSAHEEMAKSFFACMQAALNHTILPSSGRLHADLEIDGIFDSRTIRGKEEANKDSISQRPSNMLTTAVDDHHLCEYPEPSLKRTRDTRTPPLSPTTPRADAHPPRRLVKRRRTSMDSAQNSENTVVESVNGWLAKRSKDGNDACSQVLSVDDIICDEVQPTARTCHCGMESPTWETVLSRKLKEARAYAEYPLLATLRAQYSVEDIRPEDSISLAGHRIRPSDGACERLHSRPASCEAEGPLPANIDCDDRRPVDTARQMVSGASCTENVTFVDKESCGDDTKQPFWRAIFSRGYECLGSIWHFYG